MDMHEIYVLCKDRSKALTQEFLDTFLPVREAMAEDYPFPEYSDNPECVYSDCNELFKVLEQQTEESYSIYWDSKTDGNVKSAMAFFTEDGALIVGLVAKNDNEETWLKNISNIVGGEYGYVSFDSPPPETLKEFILRCEQSDQVKLINGKIEGRKGDGA